MRIAALIAVILALLCGLTACGSSDDSSTADTSVAAENTSAAAQEVAASGDWAQLKQFAGPNADKLIIPRGPSPDHVVIRDLEVGSGAPIAPGDTFFSDYISWSYESGKTVEPTPEELSNGELTWVDAGSLKWGVGERVPGWEPGLKGIRAGGLRELIVPSRLAYENGARVYLVKVTKIEP